MRLLTTAEPWRFVETYEILPYAILSHTWITTDSGESLEVSYQELQAYIEQPEEQARTATKPGFKKIKNAIDYAAGEGHNLIWIDTCCIDKTNQLELDEAIRCMFKWYQDATICYAYLSDVETFFEDIDYGKVQSSRWFTRGWTLQELVAPRDVVFLAKDWSFLGSRLSEGQFGNVIHQASGISEDILYGAIEASEMSISERMRWAARRKTTRVEDMAYSLMGIFGVHMPIMYGEGKDAFIRLQKEILRNSDDPSIFAWTSPHDYNDQIRGLLADSPAWFAGAESFQQSDSLDASSDEWQDTNRGIRLQLVIHPCEEESSYTDYFVHLGCSCTGYDGIRWPMLRLRHLGGDEYARVHATHIFWRTASDPKPSAERKTLFVKQTPLYRQPELIVAEEHLLWQDVGSIFGFTLAGVYPKAHWNGERFHNVKGQSSKPQLAIFRFLRRGGSEYFVDVIIGFSKEGFGQWTPWYIQRRCINEFEHFGRVHKLVCEEMAAGAAGAARPSYDGAGFGWHIYSKVTLSAARLSTDSPAYIIRVEPPAEICSLSLQFIQPNDSTVDSCNFVPETLSFDIQNETIRNICELLTPPTVVWTPQNEAVSDGTPERVLRLGPRDYSLVLQEVKITRKYHGVARRRIKQLKLAWSKNKLIKKEEPTPFEREMGSLDVPTTLSQAAIAGDIEAVEHVFQFIPDDAFSIAEGWSACRRAAAMGRGSVVQFFVDRGLYSKVYDHEELSLTAVVRILERSNSIFHTVAAVPKHTSEDYLRSRSFWALYAQRAGRGDIKNYLGETPLHRAAAAGNLDVVIILLDLSSGNIEAVDVNNRTPLWHAAAAGHGEIVECLLAGRPRTGKLYREDSFGINELHIACWYNHARVAHSLLSHTAEPNAPSSKFGFTPAHFAYYGESTECIEILEYFGADMEARSTPSWISTSPKYMKAFAEQALKYHTSGFPSPSHSKNFTSDAYIPPSNDCFELE